MNILIIWVVQFCIICFQVVYIKFKPFIIDDFYKKMVINLTKMSDYVTNTNIKTQAIN